MVFGNDPQLLVTDGAFEADGVNGNRGQSLSLTFDRWIGFAKKSNGIVLKFAIAEQEYRVGLQR